MARSTRPRYDAYKKDKNSQKSEKTFGSTKSNPRTQQRPSYGGGYGGSVKKDSALTTQAQLQTSPDNPRLQHLKGTPYGGGSLTSGKVIQVGPAAGGKPAAPGTGMGNQNPFGGKKPFLPGRR